MICADCSNLAVHINTGVYTSDCAWKTITQLLGGNAYQNCDLCKAYVSNISHGKNYLVYRKIPYSEMDPEKPIRVRASSYRGRGTPETPHILCQVYFSSCGFYRPLVSFRIWRGKYLIYTFTHIPYLSPMFRMIVAEIPGSNVMILSGQNSQHLTLPFSSRARCPGFPSLP